MSGFRELSTHINCFTTISLSEKHWVFLSKFNMKTQILVRTFETPHSLTLTSFFNFSIYYVHHWRWSIMKSSSSSNFAYMFTLCLKKLSSLILSVSDYVNATVFLFVSVSVSLSLSLSLLLLEMFFADFCTCDCFLLYGQPMDKWNQCVP